jgi:ribonucleotide monophosphatase NagD (HAD superfamily)
MNALLSATHKMMRKGRTPKLFLANPDLLYPMGKSAYGFTSGSLAKLLEIGLKDLAPELPVSFEVLGKPARLLFDLALERSGADRSRTVMLGDQLHTDVAGAYAAGVKSALLGTGITQLPLNRSLPANQTPDFILESLT